MAYEDLILDDPHSAPARQPLRRRPAYWALVTLCGLMMVAILLSNPRIGGLVHGGGAGPRRAEPPAQMPGGSGGSGPSILGLVRGLVPGGSAAAPVPAASDAGGPAPASGRSARPAAADDAETERRPQVRPMPQNRIPVRRAGISAGN